MPTLNLSEAYTEAFLEACVDAGMSKEAAFILLEKADFHHRIATSPGYREGIEEMCKKADDWSMPAIGAGGGLALAAAILARRPIGAGVKGLANLMGAGARSVGSGAIMPAARAARAFGSHAVVPAIEGAWHLAKSAPPSVKGTAALTALGAGAGGYLMKDKASQDWVNKLPSGQAGSYDPAAARKAAEAASTASSAALARINEESYPKSIRLRDLKAAVASGAPGAADAIPEIHMLETEIAGHNAELAKIQGAANADLTNQRAYSEKINKQIGEENARSGSWWTGLRKWLGHHRLPGGMDESNDYYGDRVRKLQAEGLRNLDSQRLNEEILNRVGTGYIGPKEYKPAPVGPPSLTNDLAR